MTTSAEGETPTVVPEMSHRAGREGRLRWAIITSLCVRPLAVLIPLVVIPVFVTYLGTERYGLYESIGAMAAWVALTNIGLGYGLSNRLMDCYVSGDREMARRYVSTLLVAMVVLLAALVLLITAVAFTVDWRGVFNVGGGTAIATELRWAVLLACLVPAVGITFNIAPAVFFAYQEIHRQNLWEGGAKVATFLACLVVPLTNLGIPGAILAISGVPVVVGLASHAYLWGWSKPWLRPDIRLFDRTLLVRLFGDGVLLFLLQSSVVLMFQTDRLVIGLVRTPQEVAQYSIVSRVYMLAYGCVFLVLAPLWPAYGEAWRRKDIEWCRSKLRLSVAVGAGVVLACGTVMLFAGEYIVQLLSRGAVASVSVWVLVGMTVSFGLRSWIDSHSILLNGARVLRPQVYVLGLNAALTIAISIPATRWFGIVGTAWSFPIAAMLTSVYGYPLILRRAIISARDTTDPLGNPPGEPSDVIAPDLAAGSVPVDRLGQKFNKIP